MCYAVEKMEGNGKRHKLRFAKLAPVGGTETRVGPTYLDQIKAIDIQNVYNKLTGQPLRTTDKVNGIITDILKYLNPNPTNTIID